jgi:hypothetical protein
MVVSAHKRFNDLVTERLRERHALNVCAQAQPCAKCGSFYKPDAQTSEGLCAFCAEELVYSAS